MMPGMHGSKPLLLLTHLIPTTALWDRYHHHHSHLTEKVTKAHSGHLVVQVTQLVTAKPLQDVRCVWLWLCRPRGFARSRLKHLHIQSEGCFLLFQVAVFALWFHGSLSFLYRNNQRTLRKLDRLDTCHSFLSTSTLMSCPNEAFSLHSQGNFWCTGSPTAKHCQAHMYKSVPVHEERGRKGASSLSLRQS